MSGNELDYYGGFSGAVPLLEDYLSYDGGVLYYDYPGMTDQNTLDGARNVDFVEYYGSLSLAVPNLLQISEFRIIMVIHLLVSSKMITIIKMLE